MYLDCRSFSMKHNFIRIIFYIISNINTYLKYYMEQSSYKKGF